MAVVLDNLGVFASGLALTLLVAVSASLGGSVVGLLTALSRMAAAAPVRWLALTYIEVIRNTPGLVQRVVDLVHLDLGDDVEGEGVLGHGPILRARVCSLHLSRSRRGARAAKGSGL